VPPSSPSVSVPPPSSGPEGLLGSPSPLSVSPVSPAHVVRVHGTLSPLYTPPPSTQAVDVFILQAVPLQHAPVISISVHIVGVHATSSPLYTPPEIPQATDVFILQLFPTQHAPVVS